MKGISPFDIPYRIEDEAAVRAAMERNFLDIGPGYERMLAFAREHPLSIPPALARAQKSFDKDFYDLHYSKAVASNVRYEEIANLDLVTNFTAIERTLPWMKTIAGYGDIHRFMECMPLQVTAGAGRPEARLESLLALGRLLRREIVSYARRKKTSFDDLDALKKLLAAYILFIDDNEDILEALKKSAGDGGPPTVLYQNAMAEFLFSRIPRFMRRLLRIDTAVIRKKLFAKIEKLRIAKRHQMNLFAYFKPNLPERDLVKTLAAIDAVAAKTTIDDGTKKKLHDYIRSLAGIIESVKRVHREWFIPPALETVQKLYVPQKVMKTKYTYNEIIFKTCTHMTKLSFYPTKDYLDLCKHIFSSDCTTDARGAHQLMNPHFFNVRIFRDSVWVGNMYMLDYTGEWGMLLVDRIQIPRGVRAAYINFFHHLAEALSGLFADTGYRFIVLPGTVSNHASVQKTFNQHKNRLPRRTFDLSSVAVPHFESLRYRRFYVICENHG